MITLITGAPGAGKSSLIVSELLDFVNKFPNRPVFVRGIPGLCIPHEILPEPDEWVETSDTANGLRWKFPDGALLILDEAQSVFRPRSSGKAVPSHVAALEVHRHQGLDIWLATQAPSLIDSNVRRLVGRHLHLRATWAGRRLLEWSECVDPSSRSERTAAVSRPWRLPKGVFGQYQSASVHVKPVRRVPFQVWLVLGIVLFLAIGGRYMYGRIYGGGYVPQPPAELGEEGSDSLLSDVQSKGTTKSLSLKPEHFVPTVRGRPESAPLYDSVRKVHQMPIVVGCVQTASRCSCYTQQGTDAFLDAEACASWIASRPFQPFVAVQESRPSFASRRDDYPERVEVSRPRAIIIGDSERLAAAASRGTYTDDEPPRRINRGVYHSSR